MAAATILTATPAHAAVTGFNQTGAGPWDYNTTGNWVGGAINGTWDASLTLDAAQTVTFGADTVLGTGLTFNYAGSHALTLRSDGAANRTITLGGPIGVNPASDQTITLGSATPGQNLNINLGNATRDITVAANKTLVLENDVFNGNIRKFGDGTLQLNGTTTVGDLRVGHQNSGQFGSVVVGSGATMSIGSGASNSVHVGVGTGSTNTSGPFGTLDVSASSSFTANVGTFRVGGSVGGTGRLHLGVNNTITAANEFAVNRGDWGFPNGFGEVTTAAGGTTTIHTPAMIVGHTIPNGTTGGRGEFTLGDGATLNVAGIGGGRTTMQVGVHGAWNNSTHGTSFVDLSGGGTGVANLKLSSLLLGELRGNQSVTGNLTLSASALNHLDISGSTVTNVGDTNRAVTIPAVVAIGFNNYGGTASGTLTIGNLDADSRIVSETNGTAILLAHRGGSGASNGTLNLNGGTLTITTAGAAITGGGGTSRLYLDGGARLIAGTASSNWIHSLTTAEIKAGGVTFDTNGHDVGMSQSFSGPGGLTKAGAGTLTLAGANTYSGGTTISQGTLAIGNGAKLGGGSVAIHGAVLRIDGSTPFAHTSGNTLSGGGTVEVNNTAGASLGGFAGDGGLTKTGAGTLTLIGSSTYTGDTIINGGTLKLEPAAIPVNVTVANHSFESPAIGGTFQENTVPTSWTLSSGTGIARPGGPYFSPSSVPDGNQAAFTKGTNSQLGQLITFPDDGTYTISFYAVGRNNYSNPFAVSVGGIDLGTFTPSVTSWGQYTLTTDLLAGDHALIFRNVNSGDVSVNFDLVTITGLLPAVAGVNLLPTTTDLIISAGSTLDLNGVTQQVASLAGAGAVTNSNASTPVVLTVAGANSSTFDGSISDSGAGGMLSLTKTGAGALSLTGVNTYTGPTTVNAGTLLVNGSTAGGAVTVYGGTLGGTGTIGGAVTVHADGTLAPGASIGTLGLGGSLSLLPGSIFDWEFNSTAQTADLLNVAGPVDLTDSILQMTDLDPAAPLPVGTKFTLLSYADTLGGTFAGLADNDIFSDAGHLWQINYADTTAGVNGGAYSSFVTLTVAIPEPSSVLLLAFGLLGLLACGRRRR